MSKPVAVGARGVPATAGPVIAKSVTAAITTTNEDFVKKECTRIQPRSAENVDIQKRLTVCLELVVSKATLATKMVTARIH
jgi:hypothetical protein